MEQKTPNEMTPLEAAEKLEHLVNNDYVNYDDAIEAMRVGSKLVRQIAAGELRPVVHAHWIPVAKECYDVTDDEQYPAYKYCSHCEISQKWPDHFKHCPECGALMDESDMRQTQGGKDDSHE